MGLNLYETVRELDKAVFGKTLKDGNGEPQKKTHWNSFTRDSTDGGKKCGRKGDLGEAKGGLNSY